MANTVSDYAGYVVAMYKTVAATYEKNAETIKRIDRELVDIEHAIELGPSQNAYQGYLLYKQIRELRIERRACKNTNELLKDMYEYIKSQQGQSFKSKIQSIQGSSAKVYDAQNKRTYTPRQRNDLTITEKTCEVNRPFEDMLKDWKKDRAYMQGGKLRK